MDKEYKNRSYIFGTLLTFVSFLFYCTACAQQDSIKHEQIVQLIRTSINEGHSEAIYTLTSSNFRKKMTSTQFAAGMNKFKVKNGQWIRTTFKAANELGWDYMVYFELSQQLFSLKLDTQGMIERINFSTIPISIDRKTEQVPTNNALNSKLDLEVERIVRPYIQKGNTAGLVLAVIDHGKIHRYYYGTVDKSRKELPHSSTIFEIGSITKTFTSLLLAQEVISGRMQLDAPISRYLPDSVDFIKQDSYPIKLVHLSNHTSGFPRLPDNIFNGNIDPKNPYLHYTLDSLYSFLRHYQIKNYPGKVFSYSNYAAGLLGSILENQSGLGFGKLIESKICQPLHMQHTFVDIPPNLLSTFAQGYNEQGLATSPWDLASLKGSGAIRSTLDDMIRFAKAQLGKKSELSKAIELSHVPTFTGPGQIMGLGWRIDKINHQDYYHHSGGTGGFRSYIGFDKSRSFAIVILSNAAEEVTEIGENILKL